MPAARMAGSSFADVYEEALGLSQVHQSPHPWGAAAPGLAGWVLCPRPSWNGPRGLSLQFLRDSPLCVWGS